MCQLLPVPSGLRRRQQPFPCRGRAPAGLPMRGGSPASLIATSSTPSGDERPSGRRRAADICSSSSTGWTRIFARPDRRAWPACYRRWSEGARTSSSLAVPIRSCRLIAGRSSPEGDEHPCELDPFEGAEELVDLARQEIDGLTRGDDVELAVECPRAAHRGRGSPVRARPGRPLERHGRIAAHAQGPCAAASSPSAQPAAWSLSAPKQHALPVRPRLTAGLRPENEYLADPEFRRPNPRLGRPVARPRMADHDGPHHITPRYLLDNYPGGAGRRAGSIGGACQRCRMGRRGDPIGRRRPRPRRPSQRGDAAPTNRAVGGVLAAVRGQAHDLSAADPVTQPGYVLRQLWLQAAELTRIGSPTSSAHGYEANQALACSALDHPSSQPCPAPPSSGRDEIESALAVLRDGRVVSGGMDGRVLLWDPASLARPVELGSHDGSVNAVAALADGRVVAAMTRGGF